MFWQHERSDEGRFALQARTHLPNRRLNAAPVPDEREGCARVNAILDAYARV